MSQGQARSSERLTRLCLSGEWASALEELRSGAPLDEEFRKPRKGLRNGVLALPVKVFMASVGVAGRASEQRMAARALSEELLALDPSLANIRSDSDVPILEIAAILGDREMCELLLRHGADPNVIGSRGACVLAEIADRRVDIAAVLLAAGADPAFYYKAVESAGVEANGPVSEVVAAWAQKMELNQALGQAMAPARAPIKAL